MQTGKAFPIFQDRDDIFVGEQWRARIQRVIDGTTLLVAIITPSFLQSDACRDEVRQFTQREVRLERDDLIIPILYVPTPALDHGDDEIAQMLRSRQRFDWTEYRFEDENSNDLRRAIALLADQVVRALKRSIEAIDNGPIEATSVEVKPDDGPGFLELLAEAEEAMPLFVNTIVEFTRTLEWYSELIQSAVAEMEAANASGRPSSGRLMVIRRLTNRLEEPVADMERLAEEYVDQLSRVAGGIDAVATRVASIDDEDEIRAVRELLESVDTMASTADEGLDSVSEFQRVLAANYSLSSTLRPVLRRMSFALSKMLPSRQEFWRWRDLIDEALRARLD